MKKIIILAVIFAFPKITVAQTQEEIRSRLNILKSILQAEINQRDPYSPGFQKPNDNASFAEVFKRVFSTVVLGKTDAIANGSAFSYSQDNNKGIFSINGTALINENTLFDGGVSLKSKDNNYTYYQKGKWSNDITLKAGVALRITAKKGYWDNENASEANKLRAEYFKKEYEKYKQLLNEDSGVTLDETQLKALNDELSNVFQLLTKIKSGYGKTDDPARAYHGYNIQWLNLALSYNNSSFAILNDSIMLDDIHKKYSSVSKGSIDVNWNWHLKGIIFKGRLKNFSILQIYGRFNRMSILDNVDLVDKKIKVSTIPGENNYSLYYTENSAVKHFAKYSDIHAPVLTVDYGLYFADLFAFDQKFGLNTKINFTTAYGDNEYNFERNYSILFGPIIRLAKDKLFSAATFTINGGFENAKYSENAWNKFVVKVSAAIPFNVFEKSK
ncbi:hypothetical protein [Flavobacterium sp. 3HN19-14]|uniref:hypothetical protein n=1 Tax=Flavobacterium sp. 3HN19-14 TaxID=3448133 RepID=UPI003EDF5751